MRILAQWNSRIGQFPNVFDDYLTDGSISYGMPAGIDAFAKEDGLYLAWALIGDEINKFFLKIRVIPAMEKKEIIIIPATKEFVNDKIRSLDQLIARPRVSQAIIKTLKSEKAVLEFVLKEFFQK
ncbi:MAG: hypothetical protein V1928_02820 [Parcubacteria group bacterium]